MLNNHNKIWDTDGFSDLFMLNIFQTLKCLSSGNIKRAMNIMKNIYKVKFNQCPVGIFEFLNLKLMLVFQNWQQAV